MSEEILPQKLQRRINSIVEKEGYLSHKIVAQRLAADGSGFMGVLYVIDVQGKTVEGDKIIHIFVKNIISNPEQMKIYSVTDIFSREYFAYQELSKILIELQNAAKIPEEEKFKMAKSYDECNPEAIILENLTARGFKMCNRLDVVSLKFAELSVMHIAKFHALSFLLKQKDPQFFKEKIQTLQQPYIFGEDWYGFVKNMFSFSMRLLDRAVRDLYQDKILVIVDKYAGYMKDPTSVGTFCHGDYRHGNIMTKEIDTEPSEVLPIDYQILHYGCPIIDLLYFIFNGTDQEFRRKHLTHIKNVYYETMEQFLRKFNINVNTIWTRDEFEKMFADKLDFGLIINVCFMPVIFAEADNIPDVSDPLSKLSFKTDPRFTSRIRGVVDDFINWGYL